MVTRDLLKTELDNINDEDLEILYKLIRNFTDRKPATAESVIDLSVQTGLGVPPSKNICRASIPSVKVKGKKLSEMISEARR